MPARVLLFCGLPMLLAALPSVTVAPSPQSGFLARGVENASATVFSLLRLLEYGGPENLDRVEMELFAAFQGAPKNEFGRIEAHSARYLLQAYFLREHGWQLVGLEPHGFTGHVSHVEDIAVLREQAPALALAMAEAGGSPYGLALGDVASVAVTLERLVYDQYLDMLQSSYRVNGYSPSHTLKMKEMDYVMRSLLLAFNPLDPEQVDLTDAADPFVERIILFERDTVRNDRFADGSTNPFREASFTFEDVSRVADRLIGAYGVMVNEDCVSGWDQFQQLSSDGLFSLDEFVTPEIEALGIVFRESVDYLEESGMLDPATKRVRLANYMTGPSNCFHTSSYFGICCLNTCDSVNNEIMESVRSPEAPPEQIAAVVANISSRYVEAPRQLPEALLTRLQEIADRHDGLVRLHSRLFAHWLHIAFPSECPFPHIADNNTMLQVGYWSEDIAQSGSVEQRQQERAFVADQARNQSSVTDSPSQHIWVEDEVFYLGLGRPASGFSLSAWLLPLLRWVPALAFLLAAGRHLALLFIGGSQRLGGTTVGRMAAGDEAKKVPSRLAAGSPVEPEPTLFSI